MIARRWLLRLPAAALVLLLALQLAQLAAALWRLDGAAAAMSAQLLPALLLKAALLAINAWLLWRLLRRSGAA
ncbi:MAG: hypothetical protein C0434_15080 [Xanthomonadaceae bacterium]|nr:hypothetical protein [Xanthomonadaceae bacterium]